MKASGTIPLFNLIYIFRKQFSVLVEDARLLNDLQQSLKNKVLDIDVLSNRFLELSYKDDQITFDKVAQVMRENKLEFDGNLLSRWIKYSRTSARNTCSIDRLTSILRRATDPFREYNTDYDDEELCEENQKIVLHSSQVPAKFRNKTVTQQHSKNKSLEKLKHALYENLNQHAGIVPHFIRFLLMVDSGYLPAAEVEVLSVAYSTVYNLGLTKKNIRAAINMAKSVDIRHGLISIEMFIHCISHNCYT